MSEQTTVTFRTSLETKARLEKLASVLDRSKSYLTNAAVERLLAEEEAFIAAVEEGLAQLDAGQGMTTDEMRTALRTDVDTTEVSTTQV